MGRTKQFAPLLAVTALCAAGTVGASVAAVGAVDVISPAPAVTPSPLKSGGSLAPVLPPEGLPTAPPPDAIKPVEPRAGDAEKLEPVAGRPHAGAL